MIQDIPVIDEYKGPNVLWKNDFYNELVQPICLTKQGHLFAMRQNGEIVLCVQGEYFNASVIVPLTNEEIQNLPIRYMGCPVHFFMNNEITHNFVNDNNTCLLKYLYKSECDNNWILVCSDAKDTKEYIFTLETLAKYKAYILYNETCKLKLFKEIQKT